MSSSAISVFTRNHTIKTFISIVFLFFIGTFLAHATNDKIKNTDKDRVANEYFIVLTDAAKPKYNQALADIFKSIPKELIDNEKVKVLKKYKNINSAFVKVPDNLVEYLVDNEDIQFIEANQVLEAGPYIPPSDGFGIGIPEAPVEATGFFGEEGYDWAVNRIIQREPLPYSDPFDTTFNSGLPIDLLHPGQGVDVYVLSTGVDEYHYLFEGSAQHIYTASDITNQTPGDVNGFGTMVSGIVKQVVSDANIKAVKILNDSGSGPLSALIEALDYLGDGGDSTMSPNAIILIPYGFGGQNYLIESQIDLLFIQGHTVVVQAGNSNADACSETPSFIGSSITVGASDINDVTAPFTNWGACVDLFAPGVDVTTFAPINDIITISGTSLSAAYVAGLAASYTSSLLPGYPYIGEVKDFVVYNATFDVLNWNEPIHSLSPNVFSYIEEDGSLMHEPPGDLNQVYISTSISTDSTFSISWDEIPSTSYYKIEEVLNGVGGGFSTYYISDINGVVTKTYTNKPDGDYSYNVQACNNYGCSSVVSSAVITADAPAPEDIASITISTEHSLSGSFTVSWDVSPTATDYFLNSSFNGVWSGFVDINNTVSKSYTNKANGTYKYQVKACSLGGCSSIVESNEIVVDVELPEPPAYIKPSQTTVESGYFNVGWSSSEAATYYKYSWKKDAGSWSYDQNFTTTFRKYYEYVGTGNGQYTYRVAACNLAGCSDHVESVPVTITNTELNLNLVITTARAYMIPGNDYINITWESATGGNANFYITANYNGKSKTIITQNPGSYKYYPKETGTYTFIVRACNDTGCGYSFNGAGGVSFTYIPPIWHETGGDVENDGLVSANEPTSDLVPSLPARAGVNTGQATYSIPVELPPGRNGMQPSVSIQYSSGRINGVAGKGFALSATGSIHFCSATLAQDVGNLVSYGTNIPSNVRLCLNGQRLVKAPTSSSSYGINGAIYHTEIDNGIVVTQSGTASEGLGDSGITFTVSYLDGRVEGYGLEEASVESVASEYESSWLLKYQSDVTGKNNITYNYSSYGLHEKLLTSINYTGETTLLNDGPSNIIFNYETRGDKSIKYRFGRQFETSQRLSRIDVKHDANILHNYQFTYGDASIATGSSLLRSVTKCLGSLTTSCLPETSFNWQEDDVTYEPKKLSNIDSNVINLHPTGDFNGDGIPESIQVSEVSNGTFKKELVTIDLGDLNTTSLKELSTDDEYRPKSQGLVGSFDVNSDGITDSVLTEGAAHLMRLKFYSGGSYLGQYLTDISSASNTIIDKVMHIDINQDGLLDLVVSYNVKGSGNKASFYIKGYLALGPMPDIDYDYADNNVLLAEIVDYDLINEATDFNTGLYYVGKEVRFNDDIYVDLLLYRDYIDYQDMGHKILLSSGYSDEYFWNITSFSSKFSESGLNEFHRWVDINNDGLVDFVSVRPVIEEFYPYVTSDSHIHSNEENYNEIHSQTYQPLDLSRTNADGDLVYKYNSASVWRYRLNKGDGSFTDGEDLIVDDATNKSVKKCRLHWPDDITYYGDLTPVVGDDEAYEEAYENYDGTCILSNSLGDSVLNVALSPVLGSLIQPTDINQDGRMELTIPNVAGINHIQDDQVSDTKTQNFEVNPYEFYFDETEDKFGLRPLTGYSMFSTLASGSNSIDISGDGLTDYIYNNVQGNADTSFEDEGVYIYENLGSGGTKLLPDTLLSVNNGMNIISAWEYHPLPEEFDRNSTEDSLYRTKAGNDIEDEFGGIYSYLTPNSFVVSKFTQRQNVDYSPNIVENDYSYQGFAYNKEGRGSSGFHSIIVEDKIKEIKTRTDFLQTFPFTGKPKAQATYLSGVNINYYSISCNNTSYIACTTYDWRVNSNNTSNIYLYSKISKQSDYDASAYMIVLPGMEPAYPLLSQSTTTVTDIGEFGNVKVQNNTHYDVNYGTNEMITTNVYDETVGWPKLNSTTTVYKTVTSRHSNDPFDLTLDEEKTITSVLTDYDLNVRKPQKITVNSSDATHINKIINTNYNAYGLVNWFEQEGQVYSVVDGTPTRNSINEKRKTVFTYTRDGLSVSEDGHLPLTVTNAESEETSFTYDVTTGQVITTTLPTGLQTRNSYDDYNRVRTVDTLDYLGAALTPTTYYAYKSTLDNSAPNSAFSQRITQQVGSPDVTEYFDYLNRPVRSSVVAFDENLIFKDTQYNNLGQVSFSSVPYKDINGGSDLGSTYYWERLGRLEYVETDSIIGKSNTTILHSGFDKTTKVNSDLINRTYSNSLGQLMSSSDDNFNTSYFSYDSMGNPIVIEDVNGNKIKAKYNGFGHKIYVEDPNQGTTSYITNSFGEVEFETDANENTIDYEYDLLGRLTKRIINYKDEALTNEIDSFMYDTKGLLKLECKGTITLESCNGDMYKFYEYDSNGRVLKITSTIEGKSYPVEYQYDTYYGRIKAIVYPNDLTLEYQYDSNGYLLKEVNAQTGYVYREIRTMDAWQNVTGDKLTNGLLFGDYHFSDSTGQMLTSEVKKGSEFGEYRHHIGYTGFDHLGNVTDQTNFMTNLVEHFDYDSLNRLDSSTHDNGGEYCTDKPELCTVNYDYDASGNISVKSNYATDYQYGDSAKNIGNAGPNAVHQVTKINGAGAVNFTYDNKGNMTSGDNMLAKYNAFSKPVYIDKNGSETEFSYGADMMRYKKVNLDTGISTIYVGKLYEADYQNDKLIAWRAYLGKATIKYDETNAHQLIYTHSDRLGNGTTFTNHDGEVLNRQSYTPFGKVSAQGSTSILTNLTNRGFTGHESLDTAELVHMNGRIYDPNLGRFMSVDPFIQSPTNTQSINAYSYIMNNPVNGTDPTGYEWVEGCIADGHGNDCGAPSGGNSKGCGGFGCLPGEQPSGASKGQMTAAANIWANRGKMAPWLTGEFHTKNPQMLSSFQVFLLKLRLESLNRTWENLEDELNGIKPWDNNRKYIDFANKVGKELKINLRRAEVSIAKITNGGVASVDVGYGTPTIFLDKEAFDSVSFIAENLFHESYHILQNEDDMNPYAEIEAHQKVLENKEALRLSIFGIRRNEGMIKHYQEELKK
ncbi:RHS repeat-associated core domain-containing protein [Thalassomonas sp. M1454]|uniref:RHS repeat-associated core domain-containing protein n=1 Tax=Thalassomonas sp. M1454 TaxID=2594477 RepID=UPI00163D9CAD|nr:RHS repeat-associated core domain-containing protein [Thalassomonas sp. M1454]